MLSTARPAPLTEQRAPARPRARTTPHDEMTWLRPERRRSMAARSARAPRAIVQIVRMGGGVSAIGAYGWSSPRVCVGYVVLIRLGSAAAPTTGIATITQPWQWSTVPGTSGEPSE